MQGAPVNGLAFHLGGQEREFVDVTVKGRSHPKATDYWDGNWLRSEVRVVAGGFRGAFEADFRAEEFARFLKELEALYASLRGAAVFATLEEQLRLELDGDGRGHIAVRGQARDQAGTGHQLLFRLQLDQTMLSAVLDDLRRLVAAYPTISAGTA
jgi:hypothetical protein